MRCPPRRAEDAVLVALRAGITRTGAIISHASAAGHKAGTVRVALRRLVVVGRLRNPTRGLYALILEDRAATPAMPVRIPAMLVFKNPIRSVAEAARLVQARGLVPALALRAVAVQVAHAMKGARRAA